MGLNQGKRIPPLKVGPSDDYKALLRGEIEPEEYVNRVRIAVQARVAMQEHRRGKPISFSWPTRPTWPWRKG